MGLLSMQFEDIIKFFKMMKTNDDDAELDAFRIGQLLMKHTEHVQIPDRTLEYLTSECTDEEVSLEEDESWEAESNTGGSWMSSLSRMLSFGSTRRRSNFGSASARLPVAAATDDA